MFEAVLSKGAKTRSHYGSAGLASVFLHALILMGAFGLISTRVTPPEEVLIFRRPLPRPEKPVPRTGLEPAVFHERQAGAIIAPTVLPTLAPPQTPVVALDMSGMQGDVPAEPGGSELRGTFAPEAGEAQPFREAEMTRPEYLSGPSPEYTPKALEKEIEGLMVVRCIVDLEGYVRSCRVVKSLPYMDRAVIQALEARRYTPAKLGGKPVTVDYEFRMTLVLPQ